MSDVQADPDLNDGVGRNGDSHPDTEFVSLLAAGIRRLLQHGQIVMGDGNLAPAGLFNSPSAGRKGQCARRAASLISRPLISPTRSKRSPAGRASA